MKYTLCEFEYGYEGQFYQVEDENGFVKFVDLDGNDIELIPPYGYHVVDETPDLPAWATN